MADQVIHSGSSPGTRDRTSFPPIDDRAIAKGFRICRQLVRQKFATLSWAISNLPAAEHGAVSALLVYLQNGMELADKRAADQINQDLISDFRLDLTDTFAGQAVSPEWCALVVTQDLHNIPRQFLYEFIEGIDWLMRFPPPENWDALVPIATRTGGSIMAACCPILGAEKPDAIPYAMKLGQALMICWWISRAAHDIRVGIQRLATADFTDCELPLQDLLARPAEKPLAWFTRLHAHRIESLIRESAPLLKLLSFDGVRVVKTLCAICYRISNNLRINPPCILDSDGGVLPESDWKKMRTRHFLGLQLEVPFEIPSEHH